MATGRQAGTCSWTVRMVFVGKIGAARIRKGLLNLAGALSYHPRLFLSIAHPPTQLALCPVDRLCLVPKGRDLTHMITFI